MAIQNPNPPNSGGQYEFTDVQKRVNFMGTAEIDTKKLGLELAEKIYSEQTGSADNLMFFQARSARWYELEKWATGTQNMEQFLDFLDIVDKNKAFVKLDMSPIQDGPQYLHTLIASICENEEYPSITAIDDASVKTRQEEKENALFRMHDVETIAHAQQATGMNLESPTAYVPDDPVSADAFFDLQYRQPMEIEMEEFVNSFLAENDYANALRHKMVRTMIINNLNMLKVHRLGKKYYVRLCQSQSCFYNFFLNDIGKQEMSYAGDFYNLKLKDIRTKYGISKDRPNGITEKQLFDLAKLSSKRYTSYSFNWIWRNDYAVYNYNRPWDDLSIYVMDFAYRVSESDYYVAKTDNFGKKNIAPKESLPKPESEDAVVMQKSKDRWWTGVYCPDAKLMLSWGRSEITILDYNREEDLCPYTMVIPGNNGMYVTSLFERIMEPLKEKAITKLKIKQLIAQLRPAGIKIDIESARNVSIGGKQIGWRDIIRIYNQTGNEIWSSKSLDPNEKAMPAIGEPTSDRAMEKIVGLSQHLASLDLQIRTLIGVPPYRDGASVGERTSGTMAESQNESSFNVTNFIQTGCNNAIQDVLHKIVLLYWQDMIKSGHKDWLNAKFRVDVRMKQTAYEQQLLERNIDTAMKTIDKNGNPLISFKDAQIVRSIKDFKLAERYLAAVEEKNRKLADAQAERNNLLAQQTAMQANQQKAQNDAQLAQQNAQVESQLKDAESRRNKEEKLITGILGIFQASVTSGQPFPEMLQPLAAQVITNLGLPLAVENSQMKQGLAQAAQQQQQPQLPAPQNQQPQMAPEQPEMQPQE